MTIHQRDDEPLLRADLLERLAGFRASDRGGIHPLGENLFTYCSLERERIAAIEMPHPIIGIILRGSKEVWLGDNCETLRPGMVFVLPRNVPLDVVNIPDERLGLYESLLLELQMLPPGVPPLTAGERDAVTAVPGRFRLQLSRDLVEALSHATSALSDERQRETICRLRLAEVMALLRHSSEARPLFDQSLGDEVGWLVRSEPTREWTVAEMAARLGIGASTLRRRLVNEGRPFRRVLTEARMQSAHAMLSAGAGSTAAAEAAGYTSRSHFARRYREAFGTTPAGRLPQD